MGVWFVLLSISTWLPFSLSRAFGNSARHPYQRYAARRRSHVDVRRPSGPALVGSRHRPSGPTDQVMRYVSILASASHSAPHRLRQCWGAGRCRCDTYPAHHHSAPHTDTRYLGPGCSTHCHSYTPALSHAHTFLHFHPNPHAASALHPRHAAAKLSRQ